MIYWRKTDDVVAQRPYLQSTVRSARPAPLVIEVRLGECLNGTAIQDATTVSTTPGSLLSTIILLDASQAHAQGPLRSVLLAVCELCSHSNHPGLFMACKQMADAIGIC